MAISEPEFADIMRGVCCELACASDTSDWHMRGQFARAFGVPVDDVEVSTQPSGALLVTWPARYLD